MGSWDYSGWNPSGGVGAGNVLWCGIAAALGRENYGVGGRIEAAPGGVVRVVVDVVSPCGDWVTSVLADGEGPASAGVYRVTVRAWRVGDEDRDHGQRVSVLWGVVGGGPDAVGRAAVVARESVQAAVRTLAGCAGVVL